MFQDLGICQFSKIPHFSSVINWSLRLGLDLQRNAGHQTKPYQAIVDMSIDVGRMKAMSVLRFDLEQFANRSGALRLEDCQCVAVEVATTWTGETVKDTLEAVFEVVGNPSMILKDNGSDLAKGVKDMSLPALEDIGHITANALKEQYTQFQWFDDFISEVPKIGSRLRQTELAFLCPPNVRSKGRFQSISRLAIWAKNITTIVKGKFLDDQDHQKLIVAAKKILTLGPPIERFNRICELTNSIGKLFKKNGLSSETNEEARNILANFPSTSLVKFRLEQWLNRQENVIAELGISMQAIPVSTDVIESLFGRFKHILKRSPRSEINQIVYLLPTLCGNITPEQINLALTRRTDKDLKAMIESEFLTTMEKKRRDISKKLRNSDHKDMSKSGKLKLTG